jgi:acylphosphatase
MNGRIVLPAPDTECRLLRVEGRVQGVGFREACVQRAQALGVTGFVRNRRDGAVEVMLQGPAAAVARMVAWLHAGPPLAQVERVTITTPQPPVETLQRFERRPTL